MFVDHKPEWVCWQTGLELRYLETTLFSLKQVLQKVVSRFDYHEMKVVIRQDLDRDWSQIELSSILEVCLPQDTVVIKRPLPTNDIQGAISKQADCVGNSESGKEDSSDKDSVEKEDTDSSEAKEDNKENEVEDGTNEEKLPQAYQAIVLDPNPKSVCQLLALAVEHIDTLLEDWYPSLGTRFLHTSEGKMLVTRLVPCPRCLALHKERQALEKGPDAWKDWHFLSKENFDEERRLSDGSTVVMAKATKV